jgi:hypothetical protein
MATLVYNICTPNQGATYVFPFVLVGYYATYCSQYNAPHMALYFNCRHGRILWLNGCNLSQTEPVLPSDMPPEQYLDCIPLRERLPPHTADAVRDFMYNICNEEAFEMT